MPLQSNLITIIHNVSNVDLDNFVYAKVRFTGTDTVIVNGTPISGVAGLVFPLIIKSFSAATDASVVLLGSPRNAAPWECGPLGNTIDDGLCVTLPLDVDGVFQSLCSFVFDGVDEYIDLTTQYNSALTGTNKKFSFSCVVKRQNTGSVNAIWDMSKISAPQDNAISIFFSSVNAISVNIAPIASSNTFYGYDTLTKYASTSIWYYITIDVDATQVNTVDKLKIYVNGVQDTGGTTPGTPSNNIGLSTMPLLIGIRGHLSQASNMFVNSWSISSDIIGLANHQTIYNGGDIKKYSDILTSNLLLEEYPQDASFGAGKWTFTSGTETVNMEIEDQDCDENPY